MKFLTWVHSVAHRPSWCLWCALMGLLTFYHSVGEQLGLPHGGEVYIESWAMSIAPGAAHDS